jgi:hypothetical protein
MRDVVGLCASLVEDRDLLVASELERNRSFCVVIVVFSFFLGSQALFPFHPLLPTVKVVSLFVVIACS